MQAKARELLESVDVTSWHGAIPSGTGAEATDALETGRILYAPKLRFGLSEAEQRFLSPDYLQGKSKNVSFRPASGALGGTHCQGSERDGLLGMLQRYYACSSDLLRALVPEYKDHLSPGFTSFRPAEIVGRATSWRRDDTRLHVDAFPSRPLQGLRILRVFTNINPGRPRIWRVGEPFEQVAARFAPGIKPPFPGSSWLLHRLHIVKALRTEYDHFMLGIHDQMKADQNYQSQVSQTELAFPPGATWACFTDSVSHAAMSGQFALEQTFYLPVSAMKDPERSPLRVLERLTGHRMTKG
jgi:hypothetical protein